MKKGTKGDASELKPTLMVAAPAILDRVRDGVSTKVVEKGGFAKKLFNMAYKRRLAAIEGSWLGVWGIEKLLWDAVVFKRIRSIHGGNIRFMLYGGAPLSGDTQRFINICMGIALQANLPSVRLSALENMHYSHMIRFDNVEEARRLQLLIDKLKLSKPREFETKKMESDCCSEIETEGDDLSLDGSHMSYFQEASTTNSAKSQSHSSMEELNDDLPLTSLFHSRKNSTKQKTTSVHVNSKKPTQALPESMPRFSESQQSIGRKRIRVILSDDEGQMYEDVEEVECPRLRRQKGLEEQIATSDEFKNGDNLASPAFEFKDVPLANSKCAMSTCIPANVEESTCSYKSRAKVAV